MGWDMGRWLGWTPKKDVRRLFQEADELAAKLADEWTARAKEMPIQDPDSSDLLHMPVYDCATDLYELPCAAPRKQLSTPELPDIFRGWADEETRHRTGVMIGPRAHALIDGRDFVDLLYNQTHEPGACVTRIVRVGEDLWNELGWRSGMRPSAGGLDPQFHVTQIAAKPSLWLAREMATLTRRRAEPDWIRACRLCTHRP